MRRVCPVLPALFLYTARYPVFGKSWGYASDMLEKYSKTLTEQADIMFKDVLTAEINNYTENDDFMIRKAGQTLRYLLDIRVHQYSGSSDLRRATKIHRVLF